MADSRPNIVLIVTDQWRGDCLSVAGHSVVQTPYLDALSLDGVRFSSAYTATPSCIPARAALFTGQSQECHGRVGYRDGVPWNYPVTLAGEFTRHGYQTQAIGKMHVYPERSQLGFQNVILHDGYLHYARKNHAGALDLVDDYIPWLREQLGRDADYFEHGLNCNSYVARPWDRDEYLHPTNWVVSEGISFLKRRDPRKPFFLYLSFHRPHPPYDPPRWAFEQYVCQDMPPPPVGDWAEHLAPLADPLRSDTPVGEIDPRMLHRARAGYYGHLSHIDQQVNRFLEALAEFGHADSTYVCFTSDHGELLGDHHLFRKSLPYEGSARIPLILKGTASVGLVRGSVRDEVVELRDLMPTLLDCAGLPIPDSVQGKSLLPLARGEAPDAEWRPYLHGEHTVFAQSVHYITDGHFKYVWYSGDGHEELFDLHADPQELHDLSREAPGRLTTWREYLIRSLTGREEGFTDGVTLRSGRPVSPVLSHVNAGVGGVAALGECGLARSGG